MARILGISCYYHDSAAALVADGRIIAAAQEERFSRKKHDAGFPARAVDFCLKQGGIERGDLDAVVFYEKPLLKFDRILESYLNNAPHGFKSFHSSMPNWLKEKLYHPRMLRKAMGKEYKKAILFSGHHESHAASAFYPSPFEEAAILTLDGVGEWETATIWHGNGESMKQLASLKFPHSLGLLYSAFTYYLGFKVNSGEYKVMGLAPYGQPCYADRILEHLLDLKEDGSFTMDMRYFNFVSGLTMTAGAFHDLFEGPPRKPETPLTRREMDLAASLQLVTEKIVMKMARHTRSICDVPYLCLAGGVALNSVANGVLSRSKIFEKMWIQPAAGDAGGALGAALCVAYQGFGARRQVEPGDSMRGALLGPSFSAQEIKVTLENSGMVFRWCETEAGLLSAVVEALERGEVVGWFYGAMEFGPRALGARSILGDPRNHEMQQRLNLKIKYRESFRPFAPAIPEERLSEYFNLRGTSPYMLLVDEVAENVRLTVEEINEGDGEDYIRSRLGVQRSTIPAVTHVNNSARIQTVDAVRHGRFYRLLKSWDAATGCPVLVNTSFNIRGEPIVCTPDDAIRCFRATEMDLLVLGDFLVTKQDNPADEAGRLDHVGKYPLD